MDEMLKLALSFYGLKEIPGEENNPKILKFFKEIGQGWVQDDETSWCSSYINWCAYKTGMEYTGKLDARSWLRVGYGVVDPSLGDVVVYWRDKPNSWKGHVGLFINKQGSEIYTLGGNQSNMVNISPYPLNRLLGYRRLKKVRNSLIY
ncbi:TIGR02594 family protein [Patescibacteria group bacterium]|uniref:Peptidase C51 domain-containing protein n=1 Tax=viral metagenome TaxID=1070528 RepID=A0A6M3MCD3_9ZZZZ|nr:TIGR02594 family protein [Patescibacteria group bacterium]MBU0846804.1 TIGR02594 family protein [Patescibacteria group bacterium]MBU1067836.1 TIGR02594 family protein [Patescibacteria group bacterium]